MLRVVDLNSYKGTVNLAGMPIDAIITKATGGNGYVDPTCDANVQQAIALGMPWGVYHYFGDGFNDNDPISEADWFINNCRGYLGKGQIWLDWERGGNPNIGNVGMALAWLEHVRTTTGFKPAGIYMSNSLVISMDWSSVINAGYALWDADYVDNNTPISNFQMDSNRDPNPHWDGNVNDVMWQFTSTGQVDGYSGNLDCSFFYGTRVTWSAYINAPAPVTPDPAPAPVVVNTPVDAPPEQPSPPLAVPVAVPEPEVIQVTTPAPTPATSPILTSQEQTNISTQVSQSQTSLTSSPQQQSTVQLPKSPITGTTYTNLPQMTNNVPRVKAKFNFWKWLLRLFGIK